MKYFALALALALSLSVAAFAAPKQARSSVQNMVDQLTLTPEQKAKVDPITDEDAKQFRALKEDSSLSDEDRKKKTAELRKNTDVKLKAVLTEEQWKKYQEIKAERKTKNSGKKK